MISSTRAWYGQAECPGRNRTGTGAVSSRRSYLEGLPAHDCIAGVPGKPEVPAERETTCRAGDDLPGRLRPAEQVTPAEAVGVDRLTAAFNYSTPGG